VVPGAPTAVRFIDERRPELATLVQVASFDGPLGLLLTLIEQRQLDILTVPLGELAGAYLDALATLPSERLPHLSTFVSVAAHLILIKSRAMLPDAPLPEASAEEAPDPEHELRQRLLVYRQFRDAGAALAELLAGPARLFHREASAAAAAALAGARHAPPPSIDPARLVAALSGLADIAPPAVTPPRLVARTVTLAERAAAIRAALADASAVVLQDLLGRGHDRIFMVVTFMALLELVKRREVVAVQARPWGPIECRLA
jgi:segregation and condensation protein A